MKKTFSAFIVFLLVLLLVSCNKKYVDYMDDFKGYDKTIGTKTNDESVDDLVRIYQDETATDVKVLKTKNIDDEFIFGVDISSIIQLEENGAVFYDEEGRERDLFEILVEHGVNYVRIRHWNDPKNEKGDYFGGGNNDLEVNLKIAKRAARVGMKIVLNFHYSDFWADPAKQTIPRAWKDLSEDDLKETLYQYTFDTIKEFEKIGARPHMVQIGNEINSGMLFPMAPTSKGYGRIADYLSYGVKAVKDISPDIKTIIHLAEGASESSLINYFDRLIQNDLEFDVIGLSYYSFWHGSIERFEETLKVLNDRYEQEIAVMEYSYGFTTKDTDNASHIFNEELAELGGYEATMQGQVSYIRDVNNAIASIDKGIGSFYWEPAWLPIKNAGWASSASRKYLEEQGDSLGDGLVSWANQALFSYTGKVLPTLNVFNEMKNSNLTNEEVINYEDKIELTLNIRSEDEKLPKTIRGFTNLDRVTNLKVTWNQEEIDNMLEQGEGTYTINGYIMSGTVKKPVVATIHAFENFIENASFEKGGKVSNDVTDFSKVANWNLTQSVANSVKVESKNPHGGGQSGFNNINVYQVNDYSFELYQEVKLLPGTYELTVYGRSANDKGNGTPNVELFAKGSNEYTKSVVYGGGWSTWTVTTLIFEITEEETITIGIKGKAKGETWAHFDNFALKRSTGG